MEGLFLETATRLFPHASSASLLVLGGKDEHREKSEAQTIKTHRSLKASGKQCFNCFFRLLRYSLKLHFRPVEAIGAVNENQAFKDSSSRDKVERFISHLFLGPSDQKSRAQKVHMYPCFIF